MHAYLFPGQGTQYPGMGKDLMETTELSKYYFEKADDILGFPISQIMMEGSAADLKRTEYAQPAIFLYSYIKTKALGNQFNPDMVAGHSLGEISALAATGILDFESALSLIKIRSSAMQRVCDIKNTGMAVIVGLYDVIVKNICDQIDGIVVPANYNTLHQVVISGEMEAINKACAKLNPGAKRVMILPVNGAFHSPYMEPVVDGFREELEKITFNAPNYPIYQNIAGRPVSNINDIKENLVNQLTNPVMWRHTILHMIEDGATEFTEIGPGNYLKRFVAQIDSKVKINEFKNAEAFA